MASIPPGPEKDQLVKLVNEKAEQIRTKVCKRKTKLASRLSGKCHKEEGDQHTTDAESPAFKRSRPAGNKIASLREEIAQVSINETQYTTTHLDTTPSPDTSPSDSTLPRERQRPRERPSKRWTR